MNGTTVNLLSVSDTFQAFIDIKPKVLLGDLNYCCIMAKHKNVLVLVKSVVSGHTRHYTRPRMADKVERFMFDPLLQRQVLYKESEKLKGVKNLVPDMINPKLNRYDQWSADSS